MNVIDVDRLKQKILEMRKYYNSKYDMYDAGYQDAISELDDFVDSLPTIDSIQHGHWIKKRRQVGGIHEETGYVDFDGGVGVGEPITIKVDRRVEYDELYCSECGAVCSDSWNNFCGRCGARMGDEVNE